jgi:hypothetical protein
MRSLLSGRPLESAADPGGASCPPEKSVQRRMDFPGEERRSARPEERDHPPCEARGQESRSRVAELALVQALVRSGAAQERNAPEGAERDARTLPRAAGDGRVRPRERRRASRSAGEVVAKLLRNRICAGYRADSDERPET